MSTKADLERTIVEMANVTNVLKGRADARNTRIDNMEGEISDLKKVTKKELSKVRQLKAAIAELEQKCARLEGYIERVNQDDRATGIENSPKVEPVMHHDRPSPFCSPVSTRLGGDFTMFDEDVGYGNKESTPWYEI